jgi:hypothetical protein
MFQALFAYRQEAPHIKQLVYFVRIMSAGCYPIVVYAVPPDDEQVVLETCKSC